MICTNCGLGHHEACKVRNKNKQGADCDCQHRVRPAAKTSEAEADVKPVVE